MWSSLKSVVRTCVTTTASPPTLAMETPLPVRRWLPATATPMPFPFSPRSATPQQPLQWVQPGPAGKPFLCAAPPRPATSLPTVLVTSRKPKPTSRPLESANTTTPVRTTTPAHQPRDRPTLTSVSSTPEVPILTPQPRVSRLTQELTRTSKASAHSSLR